MSGIAIFSYLLTHNAGVTATVPAASIKPGTLPLNATLPAIALQEVSLGEGLTVAMTESRMKIARIQVTAFAQTYPQVKAILALIASALPAKPGVVNGIATDSITPDVGGPDLDDPETGIFEQARDYIVRWT